MAELWWEPGAAGWEARMLPQCFIAPSTKILEVTLHDWAKKFYTSVNIKTKTMSKILHKSQNMKTKMQTEPLVVMCVWSFPKRGYLRVMGPQFVCLNEGIASDEMRKKLFSTIRSRKKNTYVKKTRKWHFSRQWKLNLANFNMSFIIFSRKL